MTPHRKDYLVNLCDTLVNRILDKINPGNVYVGHSGGKDSCLVYELTSLAVSRAYSAYLGSDLLERRSSYVKAWRIFGEAMAASKSVLPVIHTSKYGPGVANAVHPATMQFLYELSTVTPVIFSPAGLYPDHDLSQIDGTRADEAERSNGRSTDLVVNGENINRKNMTFHNPNGLNGGEFYYPIFDVSTEDVWGLLAILDIRISDEYKILGELPDEYVEYQLTRGTN